MVSRRRALTLISVAAASVAGCNSLRSGDDSDDVDADGDDVPEDDGSQSETPGDEGTPSETSDEDDGNEDDQGEADQGEDNQSEDQGDDQSDEDGSKDEEPPDEGEQPGSTVLDVRDYGAGEDGFPDDTRAIQDAIDDAESGDTVLIPESDRDYILDPRNSPHEYAILRIQGDNYPDNLTIEGEGVGSVLRIAPDIEDIETYQMLAVDVQDGIEGLEIRNFRLQGSIREHDHEKTRVVHGIRIGNATSAAAGNVDVLVEDVRCGAVRGIGFKADVGGVRFNRCTASKSYWHGFETTAAEVTDGTSVIEDPPIEVTNSYAGQCGVKGGGHYGHNASGGKSITRNFVASGCFQATKVTSPTTSVEYRNVRFEDSVGAGFQRTGDSGFPDVTWGNAVFENNGYRAITGRLTAHTFLDGAELVATGNATRSDWDVHFYQEATLNAKDATLYVTDSQAGTALEWESEKTGELGVFGAAENENEDLYANGNLTIHEKQDDAKRDLDAVPTAEEVGAWSEPSTESTGIDQ